MNEYIFYHEEYLEAKINELKKEAAEFDKNYRQDDAVFVKIKCNVYEICKTVLGAFKKAKKEENLSDEYLNKLDEFKRIWSDSLAKAAEYGDCKTAASEEAKLSALADIRANFISVRGE